MDFELIASGFGLTEAPMFDSRGLWFSDMAVGGLRCLRSDGRVDAWFADRKMIGGIVMNRGGALLCSGSGGLVWFDPATESTGTLLDSINDEPIGGINDMIADVRGRLYFGTVDHPSMFRGEPLGPGGLYRLDPDGQVTMLHGGLRFSNGFGISPDGTKLYHNDSSVGTRVFELAPDGSLGRDAFLIEDGDCDGLAVDQDGGVWIAKIGAGSIVRVTPNGATDFEVSVPGGHVTSLCFGGADGRDLYVSTAAPGAGEAVMRQSSPPELTASVYKARSDVVGVPRACAAFRLPVS